MRFDRIMNWVVRRGCWSHALEFRSVGLLPSLWCCCCCRWKLWISGGLGSFAVLAGGFVAAVRGLTNCLVLSYSRDERASPFVDSVWCVVSSLVHHCYRLRLDLHVVSSLVHHCYRLRLDLRHPENRSIPCWGVPAGIWRAVCPVLGLCGREVRVLPWVASNFVSSDRRCLFDFAIKSDCSVGMSEEREWEVAILFAVVLLSSLLTAVPVAVAV